MADLGVAEPLDGNERWDCVMMHATDALTAQINRGESHLMSDHVDWVEFTAAFPIDFITIGSGAVVFSGVRLEGVTVNGQRKPFQIFIPDSASYGVEPFSATQIDKFRDMARRRLPLQEAVDMVAVPTTTQ